MKNKEINYDIMVRVIKPQFYMQYMHYLFWLNRSNKVLLLQGKQKTWIYTRQRIVRYDGEGKENPIMPITGHIPERLRVSVHLYISKC